MPDFSPRPARVLIGFIMSVSVYRLLTIGAIPISPDEAYYWTWSRRLAVCYYDQPGMVAWVNRLFSMAWPVSTPASVRTATVVLSALTTYLVYRLYREYRDDEKEAVAFAVLFSMMPFSWLLGLIIIHDTVLMPWLVLTYWAMVRLAKHDGRRLDWAMLALCLTGAMYAKFSAAMVVWGLGLYMLVSPKGRGWWRTWPPYAAGALSAVLYSPAILWNVKHGWISLHAVSELTHIEGLTILRRLKFIGEYVVSQPGMFSVLLGVLVFAALAKGARDAWRRPDDDEVLLPVCLALPIFIYFLQLSTRSHVYGNWPGIGYLPLAMLGMREAAIAWSEGRDRGLFGKRYVTVAVALNLILVLLFTLHFQFRTFSRPLRLAERKLGLKKRIDWRLDLDFGGWDKMVDMVREHGADADFLLARRYQIASMLEFMAPGQPFVECYNQGQRGNQWDLWSTMDQRQGQTALFLDKRRPPPELLARFDEVEKIASPLIVGSPRRPIKKWHVYKLRGYRLGGRPSP